MNADLTEVRIPIPDGCGGYAELPDERIVSRQVVGVQVSRSPPQSMTDDIAVLDHHMHLLRLGLREVALFPGRLAITDAAGVQGASLGF